MISFFPTARTLLFGQVSPIILFLLLTSFTHRHSMPLASGMLASLTIFKPHLVGLPLLCLALWELREKNFWWPIGLSLGTLTLSVTTVAINADGALGYVVHFKETVELHLQLADSIREQSSLPPGLVPLATYAVSLAAILLSFGAVFSRTLSESQKLALILSAAPLLPKYVWLHDLFLCIPALFLCISHFRIKPTRVAALSIVVMVVGGGFLLPFPNEFLFRLILTLVLFLLFVYLPGIRSIGEMGNQNQ